MRKSKIAVTTDSGERSRAKAPAKIIDPRAALVAQFIPAGACVLEIDHGSLRGSVVAAARLDIVLMLDAFDSASSAEAAFAQLGEPNCPVIVNCRPLDLGGVNGPNDHPGFYDLVRLFDRHGLRIECNLPLADGEVLMRLSPANKMAALPPCSVAVIAHSGPENSEERHRLAMIGAVLPPEANIHHLTFDSLNEAREHYDLVVVGAGAALSPAVLTDGLIDVVARGNAAIGIFGTRWRELIARPTLDRLLDHLDTWFARHEDDLLLYGRGRRNAVHLGEWTIDPIPLTRGSEVATVVASDLLSLLQSLTSADIAAYREGDDFIAGEARSLLLDIFGRGYPAGEAFLVERDAVQRYKERVRTNVTMVRRRIEAILRKAAVSAAA